MVFLVLFIKLKIDHYLGYEGKLHNFSASSRNSNFNGGNKCKQTTTLVMKMCKALQELKMANGSVYTKSGDRCEGQKDM